MALYLSNKQKKAIKEAISTELLKKGFNVKIIELQETEKRSGNKIEFKTEKFQTVPVLFKELYIADFGGSVVQETDTERNNLVITKFWIPIDVHYTHFDLGTNCSQIFNFSGVFYNESDTIKKYTIS